jgi:hypothetical protein
MLEVIRLLVDLLRPASVAAFLLALWRVTSDLGWSGGFAVSGGLFSHWQMWFAIGFAMLGSRQMLEKRI